MRILENQQKLKTIEIPIEVVNNNIIDKSSDDEDKEERSFLAFALLQNQKEQEIQKLNLILDQLKQELNECQKMNDLHLYQEQTLKEVIRGLERSKTREQVNLEYLKKYRIAIYAN